MRNSSALVVPPVLLLDFVANRLNASTKSKADTVVRFLTKRETVRGPVTPGAAVALVEFTGTFHINAASPTFCRKQCD